MVRKDGIDWNVWREKKQRKEMNFLDGRYEERGTKHQEVELIETAKDRELWQTMVTHIVDMAPREREIKKEPWLIEQVQQDEIHPFLPLLSPNSRKVSDNMIYGNVLEEPLCLKREKKYSVYGWVVC